MKKIGILGGGQLGKMFLQNAVSYPVEIHILDPSPEASCATLTTNFTVGDFNDYETVLNFGKTKDIIGIEIEHVNIDALQTLKQMGKTVIPDPEVLKVIQDKGLQKEFYFQHQIPTAPLVSEEDYPLVQKLRKGGYDGKGVQILTQENKQNHWPEPSIYEQKADIDLELSVIIGKNESGEIAVYPVVEQVVNPEYNLLDFLLIPARISKEKSREATEIALTVVEAFQYPGIYAIELFLNKNGEIWVNETAPRVHNSGHSTIECCASSQFDMMLRVLMNYPLGDTKSPFYSGILNIIGENNFTGEAKLEGLDEVLKIPGASLHWYGKKITKPGRKMGHLTFVADSLETLFNNIEIAKTEIRCIS